MCQNKMLVSVIVPIYNVEAYLPRCLDSIVNQTYRELEIILVDDGSPDNCGSICDEYASRDSRIRVIHKENGGLSSARNAGLEIMRGDCLMFVDSDDWLSADAVQVLYDRMVQDDSDTAIGQTQHTWADGRMDPANDEKDTVLSKEQCMSLLGRKWSIPCYACGKLYRRSVFENLRFHVISRAEDVWIFPHVIENSEKISIVSDVIYYYYQRDTSIVHTSGDREHLDSIRSSLHVARFLYDRGLPIGAGGYYYSACKEGKLVQNQTAAKRIVDEVFTQKEIRHIKSYCYIHWRFFLPEGLHRILRKIKRGVKALIEKKSGM